MGFFSRLFKKEKKDSKYLKGLSQTREQFSSLNEILKGSKKVDEALLTQLEEVFLRADIGVETSLYLIEQLRKMVNKKLLQNSENLKEAIVDQVADVLKINIDNGLKLDQEFNVILFVGVNGVGKTTSLVKIAAQLQNEGKKVLMIAADTFRSGAVAQLQAWQERYQLELFENPNQHDPASVIYDGLSYAKKHGFTHILIDTAGRLQTKVNLMNELNKIARVVGKFAPNQPAETLLVLDATYGQNALSQAQLFAESAPITGIVLTKVDGTAKGGIALAVSHQYHLPIKFLGVGEKIDDLMKFDLEEYLYSLFQDFFA